MGTGQKHLRERTEASGRSDGWFSFGKLHGCEPTSPASPPPPQREGERTGDPDDPCPEWIATERLRTGGHRGAPRVRPLCEQVDDARGHECKTIASDNTMGPPGSALVTLEGARGKRHNGNCVVCADGWRAAVAAVGWFKAEFTVKGSHGKERKRKDVRVAGGEQARDLAL